MSLNRDFVTTFLNWTIIFKRKFSRLKQCPNFVSGLYYNFKYEKWTLIIQKCSKLRSVGVKVHASAGGYYIFPDFEVCRQGLMEKADVRTGQEMCNLMLKEAKVAVREKQTLKRFSLVFYLLSTLLTVDARIGVSSP